MAAFLRDGVVGKPDAAWARCEQKGRVSQKGKERRVEREASSMARIGWLEGEKEAAVACSSCIIGLQDFNVVRAVRIIIAAEEARIELIL